MIDREKVISNLQHINTLVTVDSKSPAGARYSQPLLVNIKQWTEEALELLTEQKQYIENLKELITRICRQYGQEAKWDD